METDFFFQLQCIFVADKYFFRWPKHYYFYQAFSETLYVFRYAIATSKQRRSRCHSRVFDATATKQQQQDGHENQQDNNDDNCQHGGPVQPGRRASSRLTGRLNAILQVLKNRAFVFDRPLTIELAVKPFLAMTKIFCFFLSLDLMTEQLSKNMYRKWVLAPTEGIRVHSAYSASQTIHQSAMSTDIAQIHCKQCCNRSRRWYFI